MNQTIVESKDITAEIKKIANENGVKRFMLICGNSFKKRKEFDELCALSEYVCVFSDFTSNPKYEEVCEGVRAFRQNDCDCIVAVGGGSAIDVSKCVKLFSTMSDGELYFRQPYLNNGVKLIAVPTTAGTGSESTKFAVIYYHGDKVSVSSDAALPDYALLDSEFLLELPVFQKKCTLLDALCQAIESWWSKRSTEESIGYSKKAIDLIMRHYREYVFENSAESARRIMLASNFAGRAINITTTTAPHAMSYKITSLFGLPHGYAVALCLPEVWRFMNRNITKCSDLRGSQYLSEVFTEISHCLGTEDVESACNMLEKLLLEFEMKKPICNDNEILKKLALSVNAERLKNNPIEIDPNDCLKIYKRSLGNGDESNRED